MKRRPRRYGPRLPERNELAGLRFVVGFESSSRKKPVRELVAV